jgi:pimeloyl-ACP methyl ester carboxylesterase
LVSGRHRIFVGWRVNNVAGMLVSPGMSVFVLVHGSFHDGSAWDGVIKRLHHRGHTAYGPTVAGHGKDVSKGISHAESTQSIVEFIVDNDLSDVVLVGHSYGGTIISKVVEAIPDRVRRLVYFSAHVLNDGESILDVCPPDHREALTQLAAASPDNTVMVPFTMWRELFIIDGDLELARSTYEKLTPVPFGQFAERLDLKTFYWLTTPRSYLTGTEDTAMPPGEWGWHPKMSSRLGVHRFLQMPGGHELCFTNPNRLADKLIEAGRD